MSYTNEDIRIGARVFFHLLKNGIVPLTDYLANEYYERLEVREIVNTMADEGGLRVFFTRENVHLISDRDGSQFANSYTQMKSVYGGLKRKKYFYLANIIICTYLSEVDKENNIRIRWEEEGVSYYRLEDTITRILSSWKKRLDDEDNFAIDWGIGVEEIYDLWFNEFSVFKSSKKADVDVIFTGNNRMSFIHEALKPLSDQGLIIDNTSELKIIPKNELYERLDNVYHRQDRYQEIMSLIEETKEEMTDAKTVKD